MGQEWAASTPFLYFTDHEAGRRATEGRRAEFARSSAFARETNPGPEKEAAFARSTLLWPERDIGHHQQTLRLYRALLEFRRSEPSLHRGVDPTSTAVAVDDDTIVLLRRAADSPLVTVIGRLGKPGSIALPYCLPTAAAGDGFGVILTTEDPSFTDAGVLPTVRSTPGQPTSIDFEGPAAIILRGPPVGFK